MFPNSQKASSEDGKRNTHETQSRMTYAPSANTADFQFLILILYHLSNKKSIKFIHPLQQCTHKLKSKY